MPTTLPVRTELPHPPFDPIDFAWAMITLYAVIASLISIVVAIEYHLGMFTGLTLAESIMRATCPEFPYSDPQLIGLF